MAQGMDERITPEKLQQLKQRAIHCGRLEELEIDGLTLERALVFPEWSGDPDSHFYRTEYSVYDLGGRCAA